MATSSDLEPLLVLPGVDPGDDLLELPLGLAGGEVGHIVVLRRRRHQPLGLHVHARPDVVLYRVIPQSSLVNSSVISRNDTSGWRGEFYYRLVRLVR